MHGQQNVNIRNTLQIRVMCSIRNVITISVGKNMAEILSRGTVRIRPVSMATQSKL